MRLRIPVFFYSSAPTITDDIRCGSLQRGRQTSTSTPLALTQRALSDTGFPQRYSESLFNVFSRLHSKDRYEGTGIGLSLCKSIVEKHRGFIRAIGEENKGATFEVFLPETQR